MLLSVSCRCDAGRGYSSRTKVIVLTRPCNRPANCRQPEAPPSMGFSSTPGFPYAGVLIGDWRRAHGYRNMHGFMTALSVAAWPWPWPIPMPQPTCSVRIHNGLEPRRSSAIVPCTLLIGAQSTVEMQTKNHCDMFSVGSVASTSLLPNARLWSTAQLYIYAFVYLQRWNIRRMDCRSGQCFNMPRLYGS